MNMAIFESVLIESALVELESEGKKYDGLYVDMDNAPERKYVKDKAAEINGLLKKIDRARIDASKNYKVEVEKQALAITARLVDANSNFQVLIDDYNLERKKVLDAEKLRKQAILDAEQLELDHEIGLLINKTFKFDREQEIKAQQERDDAIRKQATIDADARQKQAIIDSLQREKDAENARLANKEHCSFINNEVLCSLAESCNLTDEQAKAVVIAIAKNKIPYTVINY
tara:strand:- start:297 stop:986 length:690 start_codon:yes stop_codon:yes gene_type:complete